jgi:hypothetical protein
MSYDLGGKDLCDATQTASGAKILTITPAEQYFFTWYDNNAAWGMGGDWVMINNIDASTAAAGIYVNGNLVESYDSIAPGDSVQWQSPTTLTDGPVEVVSYNGEELSVTQRVVYKNSFNEIHGVEMNDLESEYHFGWYDNNAAWGMNGDWICIYNDGTSAANVEIKINGSLEDTLAIPAGGHTEWLSPTTITGGPVQVKDTNGQPLLVSNRTLYMSSFDEVTSMDLADAGDNADLSWYDNNAAWGMNGDWIIVTNMGTLTTNIDIKVAGVSKKTQSLAAGESYAWMSTTTLTGGPVEVTSDNAQKLLVSQRVLYKSSFNELIGYPSKT